MATFLTRVELHAADAADYQRLHEAMEAQHFTRKILATDGAWYHLPTAEYLSFGEISADTVLEIAKGAVRAIRKTASIVTVQSSDTRFNGLQRV
jgi:uncharacterized beta-barrel protein YwiB (DUF1934 family)